MNKLDKFTILTGSIGLVGDTITIIGFGVGAGRIVPSVKGFDTVPGETLLLTGLIGFYSLTMVIWFLFRRKLLNPDTRTFGFDELQKDSRGDESVSELMSNLIPFGGAFLHIIAHRSARVIFWLAVFVSLFPTTLWLSLQFDALTGCAFGILLSFLLSQYSTFFALVLDKFVRTRFVDFSS